MRDNVAALDGVAANQFCHGRINGSLVVDKVAYALVFKKGDAPAVAMVSRVAGTLRKAREAEGDVRGRVAIHSEKLAHKNDFTVGFERYSASDVACSRLFFGALLRPGFSCCECAEQTFILSSSK